MSEINTIKTTSQLGVNVNKNVTAKTSTNSDKTQNIQGQGNESTVDTLSLTNTATQLQSLQQSLADAPVVDSDRVSALKAAISDGSYKVDSTQLAKNMINLEQQIG